jgi:hypothetical protein
MLRVLRKIFAHMREEAVGGWSKLHDEEFHGLHTSPNILVMKSRRIRWAGHVESMGKRRNARGILLTKETT